MALNRNTGGGSTARGIDIVRHNLFLLHRTVLVILFLSVALFVGLLSMYAWYILTWQDIGAAWQYWRTSLAKWLIPQTQIYLTAYSPGGVAVNVGPAFPAEAMATFKPWWDYVADTVWSGVLPSAICAGLLVVVLRWIFAQAGAASGERIQLDGARVVTPEEAIRAIKKKSLFRLAGVPYPAGAETEWTLINGGTGGGKSSAIRLLLQDIRAAGVPAVIYDPSREFIAENFDPDRDLIFDPAEARFPGWSPFVDLAEDPDCERFASALIEEPEGPADPFFALAARILLAEAIRRCFREGRVTNEYLYQTISIEALDKLHKRLAGTAAATITDPLTERTAFSVRMQAINQLYVFRYLADTTTSVSLRKWVQEGAGRGGFLFISSHEDYSEVFRPLMTLWLNIIIRSVLGLPPSHGKTRLWFIIDEASDFGKLDIELAVRKARKNGMAGLLAIQHPDQLALRLGKEQSRIVIDTCRTKLILRSDNAKPLAELLGEADFVEHQQTTSFGTGSMITRGDTENVGEKKDEDLIVKARDIEQLPTDENTIHGYLKRTGVDHIVRVAFKRPEFVQIAEPFIRREGFGLLPERIDPAVLQAEEEAAKAAEAAKQKAENVKKSAKPRQAKPADSSQHAKLPPAIPAVPSSRASDLLGLPVEPESIHSEETATQPPELPVWARLPKPGNDVLQLEKIEEEIAARALELPTTTIQESLDPDAIVPIPALPAGEPDEELIRRLSREAQWHMRQILKASRSSQLTGRVLALNVGVGISVQELSSHGLMPEALLTQMQLLNWIWRRPGAKASQYLTTVEIEGARVELVIIKPEVAARLGLQPEKWGA